MDVAVAVDVVAVVAVVVVVAVVAVGMEVMVGDLEGGEDTDGVLGGEDAGGGHNGTLAGNQLTHGSRSLSEDAKMAVPI